MLRFQHIRSEGEFTTIRVWASPLGAPPMETPTNCGILVFFIDEAPLFLAALRGAALGGIEFVGFPGDFYAKLLA